jgi:hypothetical protein
MIEVRDLKTHPLGRDFLKVFWTREKSPTFFDSCIYVLNGFLFVYFHGCILRINTVTEHWVRARDKSGALFMAGFFAGHKKAGTDSPTRPDSDRDYEGHAQIILHFIVFEGNE